MSVGFFGLWFVWVLYLIVLGYVVLWVLLWFFFLLLVCCWGFFVVIVEGFFLVLFFISGWFVCFSSNHSLKLAETSNGLLWIYFAVNFSSLLWSFLLISVWNPLLWEKFMSVSHICVHRWSYYKDSCQNGTSKCLAKTAY